MTTDSEVDAELATAVRVAGFADLDARTLYGLLKLRSDVFVVEQACLFLDLDGRDLEPATLHVWVDTADAVPAAYLRVVDDGGHLKIGRVVTAPASRGRGLAAVLLRRALAEVAPDPADGPAGRPVVLDAQSHLAGWYARFGFERSGEDFVEDGIAHTPMRLVAVRPSAGP
jgi:ElaA protein